MNWGHNGTALLQMWPAEFLEQFTIGFEWIGVWWLGKCVCFINVDIGKQCKRRLSDCSMLVL